MLKKNKIKLKKSSYRNVQRKLTDKIIEKRGNYQSNKIWTKTLTVGCVVKYEKSDLDHR